MAKYVVYVDFGLKAIVCWLERIMTLEQKEMEGVCNDHT